MFLRTPHEKSDRVSDLQHLLSRHGWYRGPVDGEFGILTHQAVYRAKYWLGYLKPDHLAGSVLLNLLRGTTKPSAQMRATGALRQRQVKKVSKGALLVREACTHLGTKESPPGSNIVSFSKWYGLIGSWCAMFVTFCASKVGYSQFKRGTYAAYVPFIVHDALAGRNHLTVTHHPVDGDLPCYDWPPQNNVADHIGIYAEQATLAKYAVDALSHAIAEFGHLGDGEFWAVEGNTAVGNDSNGGQVLIRKRHFNNVQFFVHAT